MNHIILVICLFTMLATSAPVVCAEGKSQLSFKHIPIQYIVALGDPSANSGSGAEFWGLWHQDPGPRGCLLEDYTKLRSSGGIAPAQWKFDSKDWWLEEHGLIMEKPIFPLPPGKYVVTGGREVMAVLTIDSKDKNGIQHWELDKGVKLNDVTHLPCHAARYRPSANNDACSPTMAKSTSFPVAPGLPMPSIKGCNKQDYAVLFVIGVADGSI